MALPLGGQARLQEVPEGCPCGGSLLVTWRPGPGRVVRDAVQVDVSVSSAMCTQCGGVMTREGPDT